MRLKQIEERFGKGSNEGSIRKVEIDAKWEGKKVEYEAQSGEAPELPK
jgi:hypothetical protein